MSLIKRMSKAQLARAARPICVLLLSLGGATGCGSYPTLRDDPINCSVADGYEYDPIPVSTSVSCYGDPYTFNPDASPESAGTESIDVVAQCLDAQALVLRTSHFNDWGSGCNFWGFAGYDDVQQVMIPRDESAWEGLSFWGRARSGSTMAFTISLTDANTAKKSDGGNCVVYSVDGGTAGQMIVTGVDPSNPNNVISGSATASRMPDECGNNRGNGYDHVMSVTSEWAFYTIPWDRFRQWAYPNRVPNQVLSETGTVDGTGLLTNKLFGLGVRPPKETDFELWLEKITFYRKKTPDAGQ